MNFDFGFENTLTIFYEVLSESWSYLGQQSWQLAAQLATWADSPGWRCSWTVCCGRTGWTGARRFARNGTLPIGQNSSEMEMFLEDREKENGNVLWSSKMTGFVGQWSCLTIKAGDDGEGLLVIDSQDIHQLSATGPVQARVYDTFSALAVFRRYLAFWLAQPKKRSY